MQLRVGNRVLGYDSFGAGKALVLLHAFPFDRRMWRDQALLLSKSRRILTVDLPGFGESSLLEGPATVDAYADQVVALLDHLAIDRATVGGLSMGGYVALAFAAKYASRLEGLVLCDTRAAPDSPEAKAARSTAISLVKEQGVPEYLERQLPKLVSANAGADLRAEVRRLGNQSPEGVIAGLQALRDRPDRTAMLKTIACPTLLLVGTLDVISTPEEMASMAASIPGSRLVRINDAGHLANLERPGEFAEALATA